MALFFLSFVLAHAAQTPPDSEPPMPDFKKRVDYVQWLKDQLKPADADNAYQEYRAFMEPDHQPKIAKPAEEQLGRKKGHAPFILTASARLVPSDHASSRQSF